MEPKDLTPPGMAIFVAQAAPTMRFFNAFHDIPQTSPDDAVSATDGEVG